MLRRWIKSLLRDRFGIGARLQNRVAVQSFEFEFEELEQRQLLTSGLDGQWIYTITSSISPSPMDPGPYSFTINAEGISIIEVPDFGGLPIQLTPIGAAKSLDYGFKGHGKSDHSKVHCDCHDHDHYREHDHDHSHDHDHDHDHDSSPRDSTPQNSSPRDTVPMTLYGTFHFKGPDIPKSLNTIQIQMQRIG